MKKNAQLHIALETKLLEKLQEEAKEYDISIAELCRQKLRKNHQLTKIELMIDSLKDNLNYSK